MQVTQLDCKLPTLVLCCNHPSVPLPSPLPTLVYLSPCCVPPSHVAKPNDNAWFMPGSCAITYEQEIGGPVMTQHDYFETALELREQCNVLVGLVPCSAHLHFYYILSGWYTVKGWLFQGAVMGWCQKGTEGWGGGGVTISYPPPPTNPQQQRIHS